MRVLNTEIFARFGLAEQAINTIYLLGEQPDALCTTLVRNFTARVFSARADRTEASPSAAGEPGDAMDVDGQEGSAVGQTQSQSQEPSVENKGDSFQLSQLIFIVGHVAIKHIVYLELVERDLKRRKDEAAKGEVVLPSFYG